MQKLYRKRKILFTTGIRSEFYIQNPIMKAVEVHKDLECLVIITGAHLSKKLGFTIKEVEKEKYKIVAKINNLVLSDNLSSRVEGAAIQLKELINVFKRVKPDIVVAPYDREEAITVALTGTYMNIPVAHIGAGDKTGYNVDGIIRHSVSKLAHILFASTQENAKRLIKMGEEKWRVFNVGHSGLDRYKSVPKLTRKEIGRYLKLNIEDKPLIVLIQHPVSNEIEKSGKQISVTLSALDELRYPTIININLISFLFSKVKQFNILPFRKRFYKILYESRYSLICSVNAITSKNNNIETFISSIEFK